MKESVEAYKNALEKVNQLGEYEDGRPALLENEEPEAYSMLKHLVEQYELLNNENELLRRENVALADDNEMKCEQYAEVKKALKRACMKLAEVSHIPIDSEYHGVLPIKNAREWEKEMMKGCD